MNKPAVTFRPLASPTTTLNQHHHNASSKPDRDARFLALLEPVYPRLEAFAFAMSDDADDARDLVAETVLQSLEMFDRIRDPQAFLGLLFTIAHRVARRRRWRRRIFSFVPNSRADDLHALTPSPDRATDAALMHAAIEMLPATQREALVLRELSGLPLDEVARIQGCTVGAARVRVHRARTRLAELMGARHPTDNTIRSSSDAPDSSADLIPFTSTLAAKP